MTDALREVEGDDESGYVIRPFGLLLLKLENESLARKVCDILELYMRRHHMTLYVKDDGLGFEPALDDEDFAIIRCAILWHDFEGEHKEKAMKDLSDAVEAARRKTWARRRAEIAGAST